MNPNRNDRVQSIDLLRGIVMIIMALDHIRDYFHQDAFLYDPLDLTRTSVPLFLTRWITHFCAPIFVFLAGISANLYGASRTRKELSFFLLTRGLWLVFAELFIVSLGWTFNPTFHVFNLQVIWAIGVSMIVLSGLVNMEPRLILLTGLVLTGAHNLLDGVHVPGGGGLSILWAMLHDPGDFHIGNFSVFIRYPVLPWIGILAIGYYFGSFYRPGYPAEKRKKKLLYTGLSAILVFILLRSVNLYGDAAHWAIQKNTALSLLSFVNVSKYPPSLLYILVTLGTALVFLALAERPLNRLGSTITIFGRVPMFYYLVHIYLIHLFAVCGAVILGYPASDLLFLTSRVNRAPGLKGYGFSLGTVYMVWIGLILLLYPLSKWYDGYKRAHRDNKWLSYI